MTGEQGWLLLLALVVAIDLTAAEDQTLSDAVHRARRRYPPLIWLGIAVTVYHFLAGDHATLGRYDTYRLPAKAIGRHR